ncbi:MAG: alpha/beta hydrolase [Deltaproteobacteria bacterium]|nr:alpha/beta hydrolase [Deltaproteobacteria bacterium]
MRTFLLFALLGYIAVPGFSLDQKDVEYANRNGKPLLLDVHVPDGTGPFPAAILIHGGGFDQGSKSTNVRPLFQPLADAGFAWFSVDYRLAPQAKLPDDVEDIKDAIRWVKANASKYHVDTSKLALIGESAGGLLVNYVGTHEAPGVAAVVDFYGPSDYGKLALLRHEHPEQFDMVNINGHAAHGGGIHYFGVDELNEAGLAKLHKEAPIAAVHKGEPPFLIISGNKDDQVAYSQSTEFCEAIKHAGASCDLITIEGGGHGMGRWKDPSMQHWKSEMIAWLKQTLGGQ